MLKKDFWLILCTSFLLIFQVFINFEVLPLSWPDEALFSSPASRLAEEGDFSTPVLYGLVPGMDKATLWNSPLYILIVSFAYKLYGGEEQFIGRFVSLIEAMLVLLVFLQIIKLYVEKNLYKWVLVLCLVFDITFIRSANTLRMDMQTLLFVLLTIWILLFQLNQKTATNKKVVPYLLAGLFTGLAGMSHPFAVVLLPIWFILVFPRILPLFYGFMGAMLSFSSWLFYIIPNYKIFQEQFLAQMERKPDLFKLWGGETGGIFIVFSSQYGNKPIMVFALLVFLILCLFGFWKLSQGRKAVLRTEVFRLYLIFLVVFGFILISSESWYVLYAAPFALIFLSSSFGKAQNVHRSSKLLLYTFLLFFIVSNINFFVRTHLYQKLPNVVEQFFQTVSEQAKECKTIYLRTRPDPYFYLREKYPNMNVLEFIPGKLRFFDTNSLYKKYDEIDCFLLDENDSWEPKLTRYLKKQKGSFTIYKKEFHHSVSDLNLWKRIP